MSLKINKLKGPIKIQNLPPNIDNYPVNEDIRFAVIMSTYHRKNGKTLSYITRAINSIKQQTYKNWDMFIISDKYEPEEEFQQILSLFNDIPNRVYPLYNMNVARDHIKSKENLWRIAAAGSINMGLTEARSLGYSYYARIDDDDYWGPNHLLDSCRMFSKFPTCILTYSKSRISTGFLPSINLPIRENNAPPIPGHIVHASVCFRIDIIPFNYFTTFNEDEITLPTDFLMWVKINEFLKENPGYSSIYIPIVSCFHDTEREVIRTT